MSCVTADSHQTINRGKIGGGSASVVVEKYEKANSIFNISVVILNKRLKFFPSFM